MKIANHLVVAAASAVIGSAVAFAPPASFSRLVSTPTSTLPEKRTVDIGMTMMDPSVASDMTGAATTFLDSVGSSSSMLSFADQGKNLAGIFFQYSLFPYLIFLYFLSFRGNRTPALGNFGWQYLLLFVFATIPSGIITTSNYGLKLADVDWLHGGAEALLTITNVLIVLGFREAMINPEQKASINKPRIIAFAGAALFAAACAVGPNLGFEAHSPFLFGLGNLPPDATQALPWVAHTEPANALSIPTWAIHWSSVYEFLFAMNLIWGYAEATDNPKWKGLTWGMLPLHTSGIAACTYHIFYNDPSLQFLVDLQAFFTLLGNITVAIAAYRIAVSNGWTINDLNPFPKSSTSPEGLLVDEAAAMPLYTIDTKDTELTLFAKLSALTLITAYIVKYGELGLDLPFTASAPAATAILFSIPSITAFQYYRESKEEGGMFSFPGFGGGGGGEGLSMADVKKYGVSGTVAYVLTELAFWAVAFPVASTALYQSTGHWPDVINDTADRATVLGFIFAGANVARLLVPVRLGAALALAPWVDKNILNREATDGSQ